MADSIYDMVTVGGGLGGATIAKAMAERGARVLVLERELQFRDRVRGEALSPWGATEVSELGLNEALKEARANPGRIGVAFGLERDLIATTPQAQPMYTYYHPAMQQAVLNAAAESGAEIRRGANVKSMTPGSPASVEFEVGGSAQSVRARMVVGADGRSSNVRKWGNFTVQRDPDRLMMAGVLLEGGENYREDAIYLNLNPALSQGAFIAPQGNRRFRAYLAYRRDNDLHMQGAEALPRLVEGSVQCGFPAEFYANTRVVGPLASFSGADSWVDNPYANGIALIGDAAAASDPSWGQGQALTFRDARVLRDALLAEEDWDRAGHAYAIEHDRYYAAVHTWEDWFTSFFYDRGEAADARRVRAMPLIMEDLTRVPDHQFGGPELPVDESVKKRFFGEE